MRRYVFSVFILIALTSGIVYAADPIHSDPEFDNVIVKANGMYLDAHFDEGIELIKTLEASHPKSPAVSYFLANGYWWKIFRTYIYDKEAQSTPFDDEFERQIEETVSRCEALLERNPNDIVALFYLGNAHSLKSRVKGLRGSYYSAGREAAKGKKYLEKVLDLESSQYDAYYNIGMYNYLAGALPGYAKVLKTFLFLPGGDKEKGLSLLKIAGQKSVYFKDEAQLIIAGFYGDHEDLPNDALRIVKSFRSRFPENAWFHYWEGTLLSDELNDYERAEKVYAEILEKCRQNARTYNKELENQSILKLARVYSRSFDPERAISDVKALIAKKPKEPSWILPRAYLELGNLYDQIGMRKEAILCYKQVISLKDYRHFHEDAQKRLDDKYNQKNADIYRANLEGRRFAKQGMYENAEASLQIVLKQYPNNEQTQFALAELYYLKGSYLEASQLLNEILTQKPKEPKWLVPGVYVKLGLIYEAKKQRDAARQSYEKALNIEFIASDDRNLAKRALKQIAMNKTS
ncbi:tetratricopeptide repeat protein [bacterium]|nr:tetratricopeptide repeat protein [bacterium]